MSNPERKVWDVGKRGAFLMVDGKRVFINAIEPHTGAIRIAAGHDNKAGLVILYEPPIEYHDPYPEPVE